MMDDANQHMWCWCDDIVGFKGRTAKVFINLRCPRTNKVGLLCICSCVYMGVCPWADIFGPDCVGVFKVLRG